MAIPPGLEVGGSTSVGLFVSIVSSCDMGPVHNIAKICQSFLFLMITICHIRVTLGHLRATIGHLRATLGHLRVTIGHLIDFHFFL